MRQMATAVAKSGLFGIKTEDQALALMLIAQGEGLHPAIAARDYHVIQGRPALKADAMLARFQNAGGRVEWKTYTDEQVTGVFSHPQGGSLELTWTMKQAKAIGLAGKDNWAKYPRAMLRSRCVSEGIRTIYPGCIVGTYTEEEVEAFTSPVSAAPPMPVLSAPSEPTDGLPLYLPGGKLHATHVGQSEWVEGYNELVARIRASVKLSQDNKYLTIQELTLVNKGVIDELSDEHHEMMK
jgi:hypothetical protein